MRVIESLRRLHQPGHSSLAPTQPDAGGQADTASAQAIMFSAAGLQDPRTCRFNRLCGGQTNYEGGCIRSQYQQLE
jgi:hypothetical protein